jgi:hypothetical protein
MPSHYWAKDAADFSGALPLSLQPDEMTRTFMIVPEDLRGADISVTAELRIDFTGLKENSRPTILFGSANFGTQSGGKKIAGVRRFTCSVPLQAISKGRNRVMVKVAEKGAQSWPVSNCGSVVRSPVCDESEIRGIATPDYACRWPDQSSDTVSVYLVRLR